MAKVRPKQRAGRPAEPDDDQHEPETGPVYVPPRAEDWDLADDEFCQADYDFWVWLAGLRDKDEIYWTQEDWKRLEAIIDGPPDDPSLETVLMTDEEVAEMRAELEALQAEFRAITDREQEELDDNGPLHRYRPGMEPDDEDTSVG